MVFLTFPHFEIGMSRKEGKAEALIEMGNEDQAENQ